MAESKPSRLSRARRCRGVLRGLRLGVQLAVALSICAGSEAAQSNRYGPEVKSFLELLRHEETELEFQIKHNEISKKNYTRSKSRISILRETVLGIVKRTGDDNVPELHVVVASELDQLIEDGTKAITGLKPGAVIHRKWRFIERVTRGDVFYVFERLTVK